MNVKFNFAYEPASTPYAHSFLDIIPFEARLPLARPDYFEGPMSPPVFPIIRASRIPLELQRVFLASGRGRRHACSSGRRPGRRTAEQRDATAAGEPGLHSEDTMEDRSRVRYKRG